MDDRRRAASNLITSLVGYIASIAIGLILPRFFTLTYGSEVNGLLGSIGQFIVFLGLFEAGIGTTTLQALYRPVALGDENGINSVMNAAGAFYRKAGLYYLIGIVSLSVAFPLIFKTGLDFMEVFLIILFSGAINVFNFWIQGKYVLLLEAEGKNYIVTNLNTISMILTGIMKVILIAFRFDVVVIMASSFLISLSTMLLLLIYIRTRYKWLDKSVSPDFKSIEQKNSVLVHQLSSLVFNNTDVIMLTAVCGLKVVSVYTMYRMVTSQLSNALGSIPNSVSFSLGQLYQIDKGRYVKRLDAFESLYSVAFHAVYSVALFLFVPFMKLYTNGITDINYVDYRLAILFVAIELLSSSRTMMNRTVNYAGHFRLTTSRTIAESVINLAVSIFAVRIWGIYGTLIGTIVALLYRTNDFIIYGNRRLLNRSPFKTYLIHMANLAVLVLMQFVYRFLSGNIDSYLSFAIHGAVMVIGTAFSMVVVQLMAFRDLRTCVVGLLRRRI